MCLQVNGVLLEPRRNMTLGPRLDCTGTWHLNQVASLSSHMVWIARAKKTMGALKGLREEGGKRGGGAAVWAALGGDGVGGVGVDKGVGGRGRGKRGRKRHN